MIVFDFDGVIGNSIYDSYLTALNAYVKIIPDSKEVLAGPIEPASFVFQHIVMNPKLFKAFERLIPLGNHADDYMVIFKVITADIFDSVKTQEDFYAYRDQIPEALRKDYGKIFYRIRHQMQHEDPESWVKLLPPFPEVINAIHILMNKSHLAIATAKDIQSVQLLLKEYNLVDVFMSDAIFDKEAGTSKRNHITMIHDRFKVPYNEILFIDDKVSHLQSVSDLGVQCYLATWGFNSEREHELACHLGFKLLSIENLKLL